ncbi:unnamed protein product [Phytomonas sp. Hart1]|nr:unnamed protein product [Phytomonas sp. Hart1]|eukprot:CCW66372.1 unnamed protein product [Phytomonas sp. isolate Hart1]
MYNIETLLASLQLILVECQNCKYTTLHYTDYLHLLQELKEHIIELRQSPQKGQTVIQNELLVRVVAVAIKHAISGALPWIVVLTWLDLLENLLEYVQGDIRISNLVPGLWNTIIKHSRDNSGVTSTALCAELRIMQLLLKYAPVVMKGASRKHLPHPVKNKSVAIRVCGFICMPWVVANLPSSALSQEFLRYIQRGLTSGIWPVQEAAMEAVRTIMELGVDIDATMGNQLIEFLATTCNGAPFASLKSQEDAGIALGYLLLLSQCGFRHRKVTPTVSWDKELSWSWLGGPTPDEAHRVTRWLFHSHMSRAMQQVLSIAISVFFRIGCSNTTMSEALRSAFVLLVSVPGDSRTYMPLLLANALKNWALQLPTHSHRLALVNCVRTYVRSINEDKSVVRTAVIALDAIVPILASSRELNVGLEKDLLLALETYPSLLDHVSNILGVMGTQIPDSFSQYRLLHSFVRSGQYISYTKSGELSYDFVLWTKAVLVALRESKADGEASVAMIGPILTVVFQLSYTELTSMPLENDKFKRAELFFMLAKAFLECYCQYVSRFVKAQLELAVKRLMFFLVNAPSKSSVYCRAACAACSLLASSSFCDLPTDMQRMLCIGLLEIQLVETSLPEHESYNPSKTDSNLFQRDILKLKGEVYNVIAKGPWQPCPDEGSVRWLVTKALNDFEKACKDSVPVWLEDNKLFPSAAASYLRNTRCILPTSVSMTYAKDFERAVVLIGWGFHHFASVNTTEGRSFCCEILERLQAIASTQININIFYASHSTSSRSSNRTNHGFADADTITIWNLLVCWITVFDNTLGKGVESSLSDLFRTNWTTDFLSSLQEIERFSSRCIDSNIFDLKVLACKVLGFTWCLLEQTDSIIAKMTQEDFPSTDKILAMVEMHAYCTLTGKSTSTLPMIIMLASVLPQHHSLPNDPCTISELTILIIFIRLAEVCHLESAERLLEALGNCFLAPMPPSIDPLVLSLSLVFFSLLSHEADTFKQDGMSNFITACMKHAVTLKRPPYQMDEIQDGANISLVGSMLHHYQTSMSPSNPNKVDMYDVVSERLWKLIYNNSFYNSNNPNEATSFRSFPVRRAVVVRHLSDHFLRHSAQLWVQYHAEMFTGDVQIQMNLLDVARLVDATSTKETRKVWLKVGQIIFQHQMDTTNTQKLSVCLRLIQEIRELMLARSPNYTTDTPQSVRGTFTVKSHSHRDKIDGSDDYEGELSFLGTDTLKDDRVKRSNKITNNETGIMRRNPGDTMSDLPAKEFALLMLACLLPQLPTTAVEVHHAYLNLVTKSGFLVETIPDLLGYATDLLIDVLTYYNDSYGVDPETKQSFIIEHKIPLLSCVKTLIRLSVFRVARGCELARVFLHSKLADGASVLRIVQSLSLLLTTLDSLNNDDSTLNNIQSHNDEVAMEEYSFIFPSRASGLVTLELSRIADYAESRGWTEAACDAMRSLYSPAGQAALFSLCTYFISLVSMFNSYQVPPMLIHSGPPDVDLGFVNVDAVLAAVMCVAQKGGEGAQGLGPGLRYAVGCLCCILIATEGAHLHILPVLAGKLLILHQDILSQVAYCALIDNDLESVPNSDVFLLSILAQTRGVAAINAHAENLISYFEKRYSSAAEPLPITVIESLLHLFFTVKDDQLAALEYISKLLTLLPLDYLLLSPSVGLVKAALDFCRSIKVDQSFSLQQRTVFEKLACSGTSGLILSELLSRYHYQQALSVTQHTSCWCSMMETPEPSHHIAQLLLQAYAETDDPLALTACLISPTTSFVKAITIIAVIASAESVDMFIKCHRSLCYIFEFLLFCATPSDGISVQERIKVAIQVLITLLTSGPHQHLIPFALRSVGSSLVQRVAKESPREFRAAIQPLEREKVMMLRNFMETSVV